MVVVWGAKSAEISEAYHWFCISCWAFANENDGVVTVVALPDGVTVAKEEIITSAEDVSALTTVTGL